MTYCSLSTRKSKFQWWALYKTPLDDNVCPIRIYILCPNRLLLKHSTIFSRKIHQVEIFIDPLLTVLNILYLALDSIYNLNLSSSSHSNL